MIDKIRWAITSNRMNLAWLDVLDRASSDKTKLYIKIGNLKLDVIAELIQRVMSEATDESEVDTLLGEKLHDRANMIELIEKYECF